MNAASLQAKALEWLGVLTAIAYSLLVASNTGHEVLGFSLLLVSSAAIAWWALIGKHHGMLLLQFFYAAAAIIGIIRWL
jgi:nicotinamide riboside transporter PnuC